MKQIPVYYFPLKGILFLMFIGQFWTNVAVCCSWIIDMESTSIEFHSFDSTEEDNRKIEEEKIKVDFNVTKFDDVKKVATIFCSENLLLLFYPETFTPPPKHFFS